MAHILIVDGNPDSQRAIGGLLKYRTRHTFVVANSRRAGIHQALAISPDIILINALLFMGNDYAFPRVMRQSDKTSHISFLVHAIGALGEVARRQIEASGAAGVLELPIGADELDVKIEAALKYRKPKSGVQAVQWQRLNAEKAPPAKRAQKMVKPVQWPRVSGEDVQRPAAQGDARKKKEEKHFRAAAFPNVTRQEMDRVKGHSPDDFEAQAWEKVDPKLTKRRSPKPGQ